MLSSGRPSIPFILVAAGLPRTGLSMLPGSFFDPSASEAASQPRTPGWEAAKRKRPAGPVSTCRSGYRIVLNSRNPTVERTRIKAQIQTPRSRPSWHRTAVPVPRPVRDRVPPHPSKNPPAPMPGGGGPPAPSRTTLSEKPHGPHILSHCTTTCCAKKETSGRCGQLWYGSLGCCRIHGEARDPGRG